MEELIQHLTILFLSTVSRYLIIAGMGFYLVYRLFANRLVKNKIQKRTAKSADVVREIRYSLLSSAVFAIISLLLYFTPLVNYSLLYADIGSFPIWYLPISVGLSLVIHDTYFYWMHRLLHHKKLYLLAHLLHHQSVSPSPWAAYSFHFLESISEGLILVVLAFTLPMHYIAIILFNVIGLMINVYGHLGYEIMPRRFRNSVWFEILNTSVHHNLHHSRFKGNYGLYLRIWDRLCSTEIPDYVREYDKIQQQRFSTDAGGLISVKEKLA
jgi:sterol desaturase/sphingolipid hydroxylase (fatty acid hydroxylase superfamily)